MCFDALFCSNRKVESEIHIAFVQSLCVPLCAVLCTCRCERPYVRAFVCGPVRAFVCGPVYVPLCAALCTSFVVTYRARRQVETKMTSPVVITIQVIHYFLYAPEMSCI